MIHFREPVPGDWRKVLELADASVVEEPAAGPQTPWLEARRRPVDGRSHFVACEQGTVVGYGGIEPTPDPDTWRIFCVTRPERLPEVGEAVLGRCRDALRELGARRAMLREYARVTSLRDFLQSHGFVERERFALPDGGPEAVVLVAAP